MPLSEIYYLVASLAIIVLSLILIPFLLQIRRTYNQAERFIANLDREMIPLLKNLNETSDELRILSSSINHKLHETEQIIRTARHATENFLLASSLVKKTLLPVITQVGGFSAAVLAITSLLRKKHHKPSED
jgi:uncharacterized protein YoxC